MHLLLGPSGALLSVVAGAPSGQRPRVLIVGLGNDLAGDDGVGPTVVRHLRRRPLPSSARLAELAGDTLNLPRIWSGEPAVWLVDAIITGAPPGTVHRLEHEEALAIPQRHATVHHLSLPECLRWIALAHPEMDAVRYALVGVEVAQVTLGAPLSPGIAAGCRRAARLIEHALRYA